MGYEKLRLKRVPIGPFDKGYFPHKDFDDVPDGGSSDCKHVIWNRSALRPMFGMDLINASAASQTRGQSIFYLNVDGVAKRTAVFGTKFYEDVSGVMTDRTGAVTITDGADNLVQAVNWQAGVNKWSIYCNGTDPPWKWTGAGNAAVLGGSPPANFSSMEVYSQAVFGFKNELAYFSPTQDSETWSGKQSRSLTFQRNISRGIKNGKSLAVLMDDHIGSIRGTDYLDFSQEEYEVPTVGCVGRLAACNVNYGPSDTKAIVTVHKDGIWLIDEAYGTQQIIGYDYFKDFNQANLHKAVCCYSNLEKLLYVALTKDSTENDFLLVIDTRTGAIWPCPDVHDNFVRSMNVCQDDSGNEWVYFVDTGGFAFKFNRDTKNYHTGTAAQAIDSRWKSKIIDLQNLNSMRKAILLADADGDYSVNMAIGFGLTTDDGDSGLINLEDSSALLGTTFVLGASTLGGSSYIFKDLSGVGAWGRFMTVTFTHNAVNETFHIKKAELLLRERRMGGSDK